MKCAKQADHGTNSPTAVGTVIILGLNGAVPVTRGLKKQFFEMIPNSQAATIKLEKLKTGYE